MPVRMTTIKMYTNNKCWRKKGTLLHSCWECKLIQPLWRTGWRFLKKLEIELPYDPVMPLLGIHTEKTRRERDTCTPMFSWSEMLPSVRIPGRFDAEDASAAVIFRP